MKTRTRIYTALNWLSVLAVGMGALGCVSQRYVDDLETLYRRSQEQILELRAQLEERQAEIDVLKNTLVAQDPETLEKIQKALASHDKLTRALAKAENRLRSISTGPMLDPELDAALIKLSRSNPELVTYEPEMGMIKFSSDLTFALGSTDVSSEAVAGLQKLAGILNSSIGKQYTVRIVGHTDNVPIGKPSTRAKHPTNWHLSVHRAIAVKDALSREGVDAARMGVAGYGEHRAIAANGPKGNQLNRRVEVYLLRYAPLDNSGAPSGLSDMPTDPGQEPVPDPIMDQPVQPPGAYK